MAAGGENVVGTLGLFLIQLAEHSLSQDFGETDDGVERRAHSWDMLARNSDLCRLAASIWRLLSSISRKSLAFWIARADCVAKVWRSWTTSGEKLPACLRHTVNAPMMRPSRRSGTARTDRYPSRTTKGRTLVPVNSGSFRMSGSWTGTRIVAALPVAP